MAAGDAAAQSAVSRRWRQWLEFATGSELRRNALWSTALSGVERVLAMVQTILIARALGITEYGVYGLLFGTIGFIAAVGGFQMGLTATVFVSRYRHTEKAKAAAVIAGVGRFAWIASLVVVCAMVPFSRGLSDALIGSQNYQLAVSLAIIFIAASILSGVQDGVAQGFELFGMMAKLKVVVSLLVLASVHPAARYYGLNGVVFVILAGIVLKYLVLYVVIKQSRLAAGIPIEGAGLSFQTLVAEFTLPSMMVSLVPGVVTLLGMLILSKQPGGFDQVAIVSTGLQWRSSVLLISASLGAVVVPAFSRFAERGDALNAARLRQRLSTISLLVSVTAAAAAIASRPILNWYGSEFLPGRGAFMLIVASVVPTMLTQAYFQQWVGEARMWRILALHGPYVVVALASLIVLVPRYQGLGYAAATMSGAVVLMVSVMAGSRHDRRSNIAPADHR